MKSHPIPAFDKAADLLTSPILTFKTCECLGELPEITYSSFFESSHPMRRTTAYPVEHWAFFPVHTAN